MMKAISGDKKSPKDQGELTGQLSELGYTAEQVYKFQITSVKESKLEKVIDVVVYYCIK